MMADQHHCPICDSTDVETLVEPTSDDHINHLRCRACGAITELDTQPFTSEEYPEPHIATPATTDLPEGESIRTRPL